MSMDGVSSFGIYSVSGQHSRLSESTKRKLQALGIDPTSVTSEIQAQTLINAAQQKQQVQKATNESNSKNTCSSELELISRAKALATKMGVSVSSNESLTDILSNLSSKISSLSGQKDADTKELQQYQAELSSIQNEYSSVKQNQNSMYTAMNLTANMNKFALGLN